MNKRPKLLIAEDDIDIRELLRTIFEMEKYEVVTSGNGREALDHLVRGGEFDLILLDLNMPIMSGREFLQHKKAQGLGDNTPVIVFAATRDKECLDGIADWIKKPVSLDELIHTVQKHLNRRGWNLTVAPPRSSEAVQR